MPLNVQFVATNFIYFFFYPLVSYLQEELNFCWQIFPILFLLESLTDENMFSQRNDLTLEGSVPSQIFPPFLLSAGFHPCQLLSEFQAAYVGNV